MRIPHGLRAALAGQGGAAPATDSDFENVSLLLHGDGTNGAQNNTFIDGSTNNFTITRTGNTTQGTFSPFSPTGWSGYFDGSGDYLTTSGADNFNPGSGDWTVEGWCYFTSSSNNDTLITGKVSTNDALYVLWIGSTFYLGDGTTNSISVNNQKPLNQWFHVAVVKNSTTYTAYINGASIGSTTTGLASNTLTSFQIGTRLSQTWYSNGYISNLRVVKGTAVYTSNFTPPTSPLTAITNTSLLTLQDNRFKDNSTNNFAITSNGDTKIEAFSPFNPTAAYSASTHGGSGYFDGSGDYLSVANSNSFAFGTGDFTVEFWLYAFGSSNTHGLVASSTTGSGYWASLIFSGTIYWQSLNGGTNLFSASYDKYNQWTHVAFVRNSGTTKLYLNGVQTASAGDSTDYAGTAGNIDIGRDQDNSALLTGHISNLRIVKGTAVYTSAFTPPTAPLTAITNTSLLLDFTNGGIIDNASKNVLETVGNAQISTSVKKFGTGSLAFDGSGDYLLAPTSEQLNLGSGNWTIEMWVNASASGYSGLVSWRNASVSSLEPDLYVWNTGVLVWYANTTALITGTTNIVGAGWVHVAVCKSGSSTKLFLNGTQEGSTYTDNNTYLKPNTTLKVGAVTSASQFFNGYIDDLRITKGVARYTANFTPPTAAFPDL